MFKFKYFLKKIINFTGYSVINLKARNRFNLENTFIHLIRKINKDQKFIIFDVGGNIGLFTLFFIKLLNKNNIKNYEIHFFEPNSKLIEVAKKKIPNNKVIYNEFGLGDKNEIKEFYLHQQNAMSSFIKTHDKYFKRQKEYKIEKIKKKICTLDDYMEQNNIKHIDILKIDTQGYNVATIKGSVKSLENQKIKLIYSEIILGDVYERNESFYNLEKHIIKNNYSLFGIDIGNNNAQVVSKLLNEELNLDIFYINNKFLD